MALDNDAAFDRGDFVDSDDECEIEANAEDPLAYDKGLYYPLCIGEVLADRYRIDHKLGHGGFSVVWMAHDLLDKRDVALKVMVPGHHAEHEYSMQREVIGMIRDTSRLLLFHDTFLLPSPHGRHRVLVFPLYGPNLRDYAREKVVTARMVAARQLLQALSQLHAGGIIHRDLNTANVIFSLHLGDCDNATKYRYIGRPQKMPLLPGLWKEGELVKPMSPQAELVGDDIVLADLGLAIRPETPVAQKVQSPVKYCAPERMHGMDPSFASDMWSFMCIFAELYEGCSLFAGSGAASVMSFMVNTLGPLPASWKGSYCDDSWSKDTWYDQQREPEPTMALEVKISRLRPDISMAERTLVMRILRWGLSYRPEDRPTATQLLQDDSFKTLMGFYGL